MDERTVNHTSTTGMRQAPPPSSSSTALNDTLIARQITDLLGHYWTPDTSQETRKAAIKDWITDLREFPAQFVARACAEWRQAQTWRPTPADIRKLCAEHQHASRQRYASAAPRVTDAANHIPAADVVRSDWNRIPYLKLTAAERELFLERAANGMETLRRNGIELPRGLFRKAGMTQGEPA